MATREEIREVIDYNGERHWGENIGLYCPGLYGKPVYYTDGTKISYEIAIPKLKPLKLEVL